MRSLLLLILAAMSTASGQSLVVEKPAFRELVPEDARVEKLAGGFQFTEGPAWNVRGVFLVFSDIPADKMYRYDPATRAVTVFREPSHYANGNFFARGGSLLTCEHGSRSVTILSKGEFERPETIADEYEGKRFNSPNDLTIKRDETVWFTDPTYGLGKASKEQATNNVYCLDPGTFRLRAVATDFVQPNGLCFSPDEKRLYVADSGYPPAYVRVFDVTADNTLANGRVFCEIATGVPDGIRCDRHGNLFSSAGDGVQIFSPDGTRLGKILVPETPANLCFGGAAGDELYITAQTSLYHVRLTTTGAGYPGPQGAPTH